MPDKPEETVVPKEPPKPDPAPPEKPEAAEPVDEEVEPQEPPANLTQKALDELNEWRSKMESDLKGFVDWRKTLEEREAEKAEHRTSIENKEVHNATRKEETGTGDSGVTGGRNAGRRIQIFRRGRGNPGG